jgi:CysZ protein
MKLFTDFGKGFSNSFKAFNVLFEKGLWHFLFYPLLIWIALWALSIYGLLNLADYLSELIKPHLSLDNVGNDIGWLNFLKPKLTGTFSFITTWFLRLIFWFVGSIFTKYILLIILSPIFALLSESTDEKLTGNHFPFNLIQLLKDVARGTIISIRNLLMELLLSFGLWMISFFVPPLFFITFPLSIIIGWYFIGFSLLDYSCERHKYKVSEGIQFIKSNRGYAIGVGCVYSIFMALPTFAGDMIGIMFGPTLAVIGATISFLEIAKKKV